MEAQLARRLSKLGMDQESLPALFLLPLVEVAWADGDIHPAEQRRIATYASSLALCGEAMMFVRTWLRHRPTDSYFDRGRVALSDLLMDGAPELGSVDEASLVQEAEAVAQSSGSWIPFLRVTQPERVALHRLQMALGRTASLEDSDVEPHPDLERHVNPVTIDFDATVRSDAVVFGGVLIPDFVKRERYEIPSTGMVIGHSEGCDLRVIDCATIAPAHCRINGRGNRFYVQEMGGQTLVNGERVLERRLLGGETIRLADGCTFAFKRVRKLTPSLV